MASGDTIFVLTPHFLQATISAPAGLRQLDDGSTPETATLVSNFDPSTSQHADWHLIVPSHYSGGGFTFSWKGGTDTTSTGTFELEFRCVKVADGTAMNGDFQIDTATETPVTDTPPTTPQWKINYSTTNTMTHSNAGSPSAGDFIIIRATRDTATDTNTGNLLLQSILVTET